MDTIMCIHTIHIDTCHAYTCHACIHAMYIHAVHRYMPCTHMPCISTCCAYTCHVYIHVMPCTHPTHHALVRANVQAHMYFTGTCSSVYRHQHRRVPTILPRTKRLLNERPTTHMRHDRHGHHASHTNPPRARQSA